MGEILGVNGKIFGIFLCDFYENFVWFLKNEWGLRVEQMPAK